ncbi:MAG: UvrD-helicase domain-containing protein [Bacteroidales bacterium]|nr:UvrD-helicase domain-containing protein [Bacteroidales bacterium]
MFKVYKASAGSGKTTSLVAEYLSLCLLEPKKFRHVLAVTFTNNATAEMKERIVKTLKVFAFCPASEWKGSEAAIYHLITRDARFKTLGELDFRDRALTLLKEILYDYPDFTISTIDSFFQRIIRSFAFDLGINMNYSVEIDLSDCYNQTVDMLLNKLSKNDEDLSKRVMFLVDKQMNEKGRWQLEGELKKSLAFIYNERAFEPAKALEKMQGHADGQREGGPNELKEAVQEVFRQVAIQRNVLQQLINQLFDIFSRLADAPSAYVGGSTGIYKWVQLTLPENPLAPPGKSAAKALEAESVLKKPSEAEKQLQPAIVELVQNIVNQQNKTRDWELISKHAASLLLLFDLKAIMDDIKLRDNLFFLNETNGRIFDEIRNIDTPYIYEKIGNKYSYFFIDEFQDTSKLQWEDFKPLIQNAISGINQFGEPGKTILFGDVKQSIYRFRNGDSTLLNGLSTLNGVNQDLGGTLLTSEDFELTLLDTNHRSSKAVVEFNNRFFKYLIDNNFRDNQRLVDYYADVEQRQSREKEGFVYVRFQTEDDGEDYLLKETLKAIKDALSRGYAYQDIAVLSKANRTCSEIARYLAENQIPVISSDSLLLSASPEVLLLVNTLRYLLSPDDKLLQLSVAEYFFKDNMAEAVDLISQDQGFRRLMSGLEERVDAQKLSDTGRLLSFPVFTIVKELLLAYRLDTADAYVIAFVDAIYDNFNAQFSDLAQCLDWWEEKGRKMSLTSSKETNAVTVTSIHKSKGLQYPVVVYPMKSYRQGNGMERIWCQNRLDDCPLPYYIMDTSQSALSGSSFASLAEEERTMTDIDNVNVLYVAHTRAADALYIITGNPESGRGNYAKFLKAFVCSMQDEPEDLKTEYLFGDALCRKTVQTKSDEFQYALTQLYASDFTLRSEQLLALPERTYKQELGVFIHDFLSKLENFPQTEEELIQVLENVDDMSDRKLLRSVLRKIMEDESLRPYFAPGVTVLNETSILCPDGQLRRPDRIVFLDDEVMVIDYKTGKENEAYQRQLDEYCALLRQMGYEKVKNMILYL